MLRIRPSPYSLFSPFLNDEKNLSMALINFGGLMQMILFIFAPFFYTKYVSETACVKTGKQKKRQSPFFVYICK